jgi:hypothetical protein
MKMQKKNVKNKFGGGDWGSDILKRGTKKNTSPNIQFNVV